MDEGLQGILIGTVERPVLNRRCTDVLNTGVINQTKLMRGRPAVSVNFHPSMYLQLQGFGHNVHLPTAYIWHCSTGLKFCDSDCLLVADLPMQYLIITVCRTGFHMVKIMICATRKSIAMLQN